MSVSSVNSIAWEQEQVGDYVRLLKPRVMTLVVFTGWIGLLLAPGNIHPVLAAIAVFCVALGSGAAGAINMWYERVSDARMERTKNRPLPAGRLSPESAIEFATICAFSSVFIMAVAINLAAAFMLSVAILFYVFVYTVWLKRRTPYNIVIGGAAGAFPPVIGWAAVTGEFASLEPWILCAIVFMWTPPHFWALSLYRCKDYASAGIPMLPVTHGKPHTKQQMLLYTIILAMTSCLPYVLGMSGVVYLAGVLWINSQFILHALKVLRCEDNDDLPAKKMFRYSLFYLFVLFVLVIIDHFVI